MFILSVPGHTRWLALSRKMEYKFSSRCTCTCILCFTFVTQEKIFWACISLEVNNHISLWSICQSIGALIYCSAILHGPIRQNPTSSNSLVKVCNNSGGHTIVTFATQVKILWTCFIKLIITYHQDPFVQTLEYYCRYTHCSRSHPAKPHFFNHSNKHKNLQ